MVSVPLRYVILVGCAILGAILFSGASLPIRHSQVEPVLTADVSKPRRLRMIKAGGIPKEGLGSTLGFIRATANIAHLLDAELYISQTAEMMGYRASEILNKGLESRDEGRVCDIMEVLLDDPGSGAFQARMDRAQSILDTVYEKAIDICKSGSTEPLLSDYALKELARCDTIILNDYRIVSRGWTNCSLAWWKGVIEQYSGPAHGNDVAIHFRWGDMYHVAQKEDKWRLDMTKVARLVDIIRQENPSVVVNVYMKPSRENETNERMRELLRPLDGDFNIIQADEDVTELAMMSKARYLIINSGSFSTAAAGTRNAQVVVFNNGGAHHLLNDMSLDHLFITMTLTRKSLERLFVHSMHVSSTARLAHESA